jgi:AraC-like DNA-binding protein
MPERYESWTYSPAFQAGRIRFRRTRRLWQEGRLYDWQLLYTFSGEGEIYSGGRTLISRPFDLHLFRPNVPRSYEPGGKQANWGQIWVHFVPPLTWTSLLSQWPEASAGSFRLSLPTPELRQKVMGDLSELCEVGASQAHYGERLAMSLLKTALIRCLSLVRPEGRAPGQRVDVRVQRAMDLLSENLTRPLDTAGLSRACGLSERQLFRLFARHAGRSPREYQELCRLEQAARLLRETSLSVSEVAPMVGFEDPFYFATRFKARLGRTPTAYRAQAVEAGHA